MGFPARSRKTPSRPIRDALRDRIIRPGVTVLDYGCGRGDDVRILRELGYEAIGWDPEYCPSPPPKAADVVNFGYVLNVIADPEERAMALSRAYDLASEVLVVSAYVHNGSSTKTKIARPHGDGHITGRGQFQKLYYHKELDEYIKARTGRKAERADFGVFYLRKTRQRQGDKMDEPVFGTDRESLLVEFAASFSRPLGKLLKRELSDWQQKAFSTHFASYEMLCSEASQLLTSADDEGTLNAYRMAPFGKKTRDALYVHRSSVNILPVNLKLLLAKGLQVATTLDGPVAWELVKISSDCRSLSLLNAEPFGSNDYPALISSTRINVHERSIKTVRESTTNPSIYHRKELFIHQDHPWFQAFREASQRDEQAGLLSRPDIGRRLQWKALQAAHHLKETTSE